MTGVRPIGLGLIGCGNVARIHTSSFGALARAGVPIRGVVAADPDVVNRAIAVRNFPFDRVVDDWRDVLDDPGVDAVYVCTPTRFHRELYAAALDAGKHLYAEKPIAPTLPDVLAVCDAADRAGVTAQVGFQTRRQAMMAKVRELVRSGELGPVMTYSWRDDETFPTTGIDGGGSDWRSDRAVAGGGVLLEHSIHGLDILHWIFGRPTAVSATTRNVLGFDVEDTAALQLDHDSGVTGSLVTVYGGVVGRTESRFEVLCERGVIEVTWSGAVLVDDPALSMLVQRSGAPPEHVDLDLVLSDHLADLGVEHEPFFWQEVASLEFVRAVSGGRPATPDLSDSLIAHATVEAAYRSAASGDRVSIDDVLAKPAG